MKAAICWTAWTSVWSIPRASKWPICGSFELAKVKPLQNLFNRSKHWHHPCSFIAHLLVTSQWQLFLHNDIRILLFVSEKSLFAMTASLKAHNDYLFEAISSACSTSQKASRNSQPKCTSPYWTVNVKSNPCSDGCRLIESKAACFLAGILHRIQIVSIPCPLP